MNIANDKYFLPDIEPIISMVELFQEDEVRTQMNKMKKGKAKGPNEFPMEAWVGCQEGVRTMTNLFNKILGEERIPNQWRASTIIHLFKGKGDPQDCGNYRGIKLTCHSLKLMERILVTRLKNEVEISANQFGFVASKSTNDPIFALRQMMDKYGEKKPTYGLY
ncbi:unnamed protein product [Gordionus sp. m RMFG-2023]